MSQERTDNLFASESWTAVYTAFTNISLKAYDFDTIREALLAYTVQTYPDKFNDFIASSEFVAILDLVAYMGHSLSYRLDMNTRENFMDTAERRASILQMAKTLGYNKTRPINAKGFMKITSVSTDENVYDNLGVSLAGKTVNWNDSNDIDWYENFISILNSSFSATTKIQNPTSELTIAEVSHSLYEINEDSESKSVNYKFSSDIDGGNRSFETVRVAFDTVSTRIYEDEPRLENNFTIINRNDNLGSASDRTGFFVYAVAGSLGFEDFTYNTQISNRIESINESNISNSDVWIQKIDSNRNYVSSVTKVDNETRETAIYNSLRTGSGDLVSVNSIDNNGIELHYPDGVFGNAAVGNYRAWYRTVDNANFSVNANDITNTTITIPYIGSDDRTHRLSMTISSTKDFSENFSGETYTSVRRIAPRSYYAQDRMVNAQDYNVYPLTLGNNVVNKVKAVNTSFAGNSRFYEMDDVLGHHSNLSITGSDGSVFVEDEPISVSLSYNRAKGNSDNFVRNEISSVIKHPSLLNKFVHTNENNITEVVHKSLNKAYTISATDGTKISSTSMIKTVYIGDTIELITTSGTTIWADVKTVSGTDYTLSKFISEVGTIKTLVRGFRTKFTDVEKNAIKTKVDLDSSSFTLYYTYTIVSPAVVPTWNWSLTQVPIVSGAFLVPNEYTIVSAGTTDFTLIGSTDSVVGTKFRATRTDITAGAFEIGEKYTIKTVGTTDFTLVGASISNIGEEFTATGVGTGTGTATNSGTGTGTGTAMPADVSVLFTYKSGIRDNEAEYTATFTGKKVAFESRDQVKFFYGNTTNVIDNETNLSKRDTIFFNYLSTSASSGSGTAYNDPITVGQAPISTVVTDGGTGATFNAIYKYTGAPATYALTEDVITAGTTYKHYLVSPVGNEWYLDANASPSTFTITSPAADSKIGVTPEWTIGMSVTDLANYKVKSSTVQDDVSVSLGTPENNVSTGAVGFLGGYDSANAATQAYTTRSGSDLTTLGFKGDPSNTYFAAASGTGNFKWRDEDENVEKTTLVTVHDVGTDNYTFTLSEADSGPTSAGINYLDNDIFFKQYAYGEVKVVSATALTTSNILLRDANGIYIDNKHVTIGPTTGVSNGYTIYFWTHVVAVNALIDVYIGSSTSIADLATYSVRVQATFNISTSSQNQETIYKSLASHVYDDYITPAGYVDNTKVKLLTSDTNDNPFAVLETIPTNDSIVMEQYSVDSVDYERASNYAVSASLVVNVPSTATLYYNTTTPAWWKKEAGTWNVITPGTATEVAAGTADYNDMDGDKLRIHYRGTQYRVLEGISFTEDPFSSFRWEHYADLDKRIDPSTSNIVDMYVLSADYVRNVNKWKANNFTTTTPTPPNNYELAKIMETIEPKAAMADHLAYIPVQFKYLFGSYAKAENQAVFKVIKKVGAGYTDSEIKTAVSTKVNEYFVIDNWEFGDTFYFSELAAYLHKELGDYISSVVITPKYASNTFTNLLSISCALNEIFMAVTTSSDVKIITQLLQSELVGE